MMVRRHGFRGNKKRFLLTGKWWPAAICLGLVCASASSFADSHDALPKPSHQLTTEAILSEVKSLRDYMDERFDIIDRQNKTLGERLDVMDRRFDVIQESANATAATRATALVIPASVFGGLVGWAGVFILSKRSNTASGRRHHD